MKNIEIPLQSEKTRSYKLLEKLPAVLSWSFLALPFVLSQISPWLTVFFIVFYILMWFMRTIVLNIRVLQGYYKMKTHEKLPWNKLIDDIKNGKATVKNAPKWHAKNIERLIKYPAKVKPGEEVHVMMIAAYNETIDILEPTVQSVIASNYDMKKVIMIMAYEGRDGAKSKEPCTHLVEKYGKEFLYAEAIEHPLTPNEVRGKGGNISFAGRILKKRLEKMKIDSNRVMVTTLDSDNRPHKNYISALTYMMCLVPEPKYVSFQPIPIYTNNIWDVPALMRVIATGNSFWNIVLSLRPHMIRNFSSHAQSMAGLIDTDFWSARTTVEDGHQFWRTYFRYDGKHEVYPIYVPIYQDAVLSSTYIKTLRMQFIQIRRWAWGCSDIPYVWTKAFLTPNKIPTYDKVAKLSRLIESHLSWATAPLVLAFAAFIPILFNPEDIAANQLPKVVSNIQTVAMIGLFVTMFLSFKSLPPKPERYKRRHHVLMVLQWVLLPVTTILYNSAAALTSQTRLFFGKYLDRFDVTDKAVKK